MLETLHYFQKNHPRKMFKTLVEDVKRTTRLGNYWYWFETLELVDGIDIASIICPLRYDVLVRRNFYQFYATHRQLYISEFNAFLDLARQSPYYTWYVTSESVRTRPYLVREKDRLLARFIKQIHEAVTLYESMKKFGFNEHYPIILKTAEHSLPPTTSKQSPPTGKHLSDRYFLADGCHRLAFLITEGYTVLPANYFRIKRFKEYSPFDSTSLLVRSLSISSSEYFTFLSSRYCHPAVFDDGDGFFSYIREHRPELVHELLAIVQVDGFDSDIPPSIRKELGQKVL